MLPASSEQTITIREVAQAAGVSISTASRALGEGSASRATRKKVRDAALALGFIPNVAARQLSTGKTNTVAILVAEQTDFIFNDPFLSMLVSQLSISLSINGLQGFLLLADPSDPATFSTMIRRTGVDGVIVASYHQSTALQTALRGLSLPVVFVGRPPDEFADYPYVDVDNFRGGCDAANRILEIGRTHIAQIGGPEEMNAAIDRAAGFSSVLRRAGITLVADKFGAFSVEHGQQAMEAILRDHLNVDAVFAHSDQIAAGVMSAIFEAGLRVPDDIAVVGFDDSALAKVTNPQLTTLRQPVGDMAQLAAEMIASLISGKNTLVTAQLLMAPLKIRGTA